MKKSALGIAIAGMMAAGSVNAATIYEKGDVSWTLKADVQVQLRQKSGQDEDSFVAVSYTHLTLPTTPYV